MMRNTAYAESCRNPGIGERAYERMEIDLSRVGERPTCKASTPRPCCVYGDTFGGFMIQSVLRIYMIDEAIEETKDGISNNKPA